MRDVMADIDPNYGRRADEVYEMYRNGTVHEFRPKVLENSKGQLLAWSMHNGERKENETTGAGQVLEMVHLLPLQIPTGGDGRYWLPVSTRCLIEDVAVGIDRLMGSRDHAERITAWNLAARELSPPRRFEFDVT